MGVLLLAAEVEAGVVVAAELDAEWVRDADVAAPPRAVTAQTSGCCCSCSKCGAAASKWREQQQQRRDYSSKCYNCFSRRYYIRLHVFLAYKELTVSKEQQWPLIFFFFLFFLSTTHFVLVSYVPHHK